MRRDLLIVLLFAAIVAPLVIMDLARRGAIRSAVRDGGASTAAASAAMLLGEGAHNSIGVQGVYIIGGINSTARHVTLIAVRVGAGISDTRRVIVRRGAALNFDISYIVGAYRHPSKSGMIVLPIETWSRDMPFTVSLERAAASGGGGGDDGGNDSREVVLVPEIRPMDLVIVPWSDLE